MLVLRNGRRQRGTLGWCWTALASLLVAVVAVGGAAPASATSAYATAVLASSPGAYWRAGDSVGSSSMADEIGSNDLTNGPFNGTLGQRAA